MKITGQPNPRCPNGSSQGGSWILWLLHPPGVLTVLWKLDTRLRRASLQILFCFLAFVNMSDYTVHPTARNFPPKLGLGGGGCLQLFIVHRGESSQDMCSLPPLCHFCRLQVASPRFPGPMDPSKLKNTSEANLLWQILGWKEGKSKGQALKEIGLR